MLRPALYVSLLLAALAPFATLARQKDSVFTATAYSTPGVTAKGNHTKAGTAAADPAVIPLGSLVRVRKAGRYSGLYAVTDTGRLVTGRAIDLFVPSEAAAKAFGKKPVRVRIIKVGDNIKGKPETSAIVSKSDLAPAVKNVAESAPTPK